MSNSNPLNRALAATKLAKEQHLNQDVTSLTTPKEVVNSTSNTTLDNQQNANSRQQPAPNLNSKFDNRPNDTSTPKIVKVDISIAGVPHRINCPSNEADNLNKTADEINEALREIRRNVRGKSPSNEEILVLHCLDLYDKIRELTEKNEAYNTTNQQATTLIDKIIKDAVSIL